MVGSVDYGESDRVIRLLTAEHGLVALMARRARASQRRFGGALDTGNRVLVQARPSPRGLWQLNGATLEDGREHARRDLLNLTMLAYSCELCGSLAREHHPEPRLFGLLDTALVLLDAVTAPPKKMFRVGLEAKALAFSGLRPTLDRCHDCDEAPTDPMVFSAADGGARHVHCGGVGPTVTLTWLAAVNRALRSPLRDLIDTETPDGPHHLLPQAIETHTGRPLRSRAILDSFTAALGAAGPATSG